MAEKYFCTGKYQSMVNPDLYLEIKQGNDGDLVIFSTGEETEITDFLGIQGEDILKPGLNFKCQNGDLIDFRKAELLLIKPSGEILNFKKIE